MSQCLLRDADTTEEEKNHPFVLRFSLKMCVCSQVLGSIQHLRKDGMLLPPWMKPKRVQSPTPATGVQGRLKATPPRHLKATTSRHLKATPPQYMNTTPPRRIKATPSRHLKAMPPRRTKATPHRYMNTTPPRRLKVTPS